jgi:hypothetical protein
VESDLGYVFVSFMLLSPKDIKNGWFAEYHVFLMQMTRTRTSLRDLQSQPTSPVLSDEDRDQDGDIRDSPPEIIA